MGLAAVASPPVYATVPKRWPNSTIVCLGGGASLTQDDVDYCRGKAPVIAINDAHRLAPWADVLYSGDKLWYAQYQGVPAFQGLKYTIESAQGRGRAHVARWPEIQVLRHTGQTGLELSPDGLRTGQNSGAQAINLAMHFGARRILLLGYDMGGLHWFGSHPKPLSNRSDYGYFLQMMATMAKPLREQGITVINCSPISAMTCYPKQPLREVLGAVL